MLSRRSWLGGGVRLSLIGVLATTLTSCKRAPLSDKGVAVPVGCEAVLDGDREYPEPDEPPILREIVNAHERALLAIDRFLPRRQSSASPTTDSSKTFRKRKRLLERYVGREIRRLATVHGVPLQDAEAMYREWQCGRWDGSPAITPNER